MPVTNIVSGHLILRPSDEEAILHLTSESNAQFPPQRTEILQALYGNLQLREELLHESLKRDRQGWEDIHGS